MCKCVIGKIWVLLSLFTLFSVPTASAVTVQDSHGTFQIDYQPERVVALEFSFVDALAAIDVAPVGIADDNDPSRISDGIRQKIGHWQSVGLRSQPSLETIASLKPDLIIADVDRHSAVYDDLNKIAPTLLLPSRRETYQSNLLSAAIIGDVMGSHDKMAARIVEHKARLKQVRQRIEDAGFSGKVVQFGVAREKGFYAHSRDSYAGGVLNALGLESSPLLDNENASRQITLEQLLAINPDYLIVGDYTANSIISQNWANQPLWPLLTAVKNQHMIHVDGNRWARSRGILAAERMAQDVLTLFGLDHD